ncbi:MAG: BMP family ABC transporter substrate-binding protein [Clostridia bacterium]|nr:BMP family ABC transporter substrate-binding protein [Clostridia bacterium]MBQ9514098.1 BMP family ABC transporter substrate-binding protein [Clostridia bacterium]
MKKLLTLLITVILAVSCCFSLTACGEKPVAGLICLHGEQSTYDKNFIEAFKTACDNKGVAYTIVTDIPEGEACYTKASELVDNGCKVIFADSFGHEPYLIQAANENPDVQFCHATGTGVSTQKKDGADYSTPSNYHNTFASIYEGRYLAGYAAGLKLNEMKDKAVDNNFQVGYVGAWTYAEVISGYTSWFLGLQEALDDGYTATMLVQFTGSWYDETAEKTAAETLINKGCVLISQHADSMGAPTACDSANIPNVAYNGTTGKNTLVAYSKIDWVPYFEYMLDNYAAKSIKKDYVGTLSDGSVKYALGSNCVSGTAEKLAVIEKELKEGTRQVFDCSKFTVKNAKIADEYNQITVDESNHLTAYLADVNDDKDAKGTSTYAADTNVIKTDKGITYFSESSFRSAPYFDLTIDGITLLNAVYGTKTDGTPDFINF